MKEYILNDYERSISIKNLKSIIGTPMYKKLAAGTLRFGASNNGKGERLVLVGSIPLKYMSQEARAAILFCSERMVQPVICAKNKKGPRAYRKERTVPVLSEPAEVIAGIRQLLYQLECQVPENRFPASHIPHQGDTSEYSACTRSRAEAGHRLFSAQCHCKCCRLSCPLCDKGLL